MHPILIIFSALFGLIFGSFANVVILRDTKRKTILTGRSHCPHCRKTLQWYELLPLISFLIQGGKCRHCKKPISWQYPLVEALAAVLTAGAVWYGFHFPMGWLATADLIIALLLFLIISGIDIRTQTVPLDYVMAGGLFGALAVELGGLQGPLSILLGLVMGAGSIAAVIYIWKLLFKKDGMGSGDIWLAGAIGATTGFPGIAVALFAAIFSGALVGIGLIIAKKSTMEAKIPFGPFLVVGLVVALLWGTSLIRWYTSISGISY